MKIELPDISTQHFRVFEESTKAAIAVLAANLDSPRLSSQTLIDESQFARTHLLRKREGWEPPDPAVVRAYFAHFQSCFDQFGTDEKLAALLGLSTKRRIRAFKNGGTTVPYDVWRHFLVLTGRAPQDVVAVMAVIG